jgi:hypothetical protein
LKPVKQKVKGLRGVLEGLQTGTIEWIIEYDEGMPYVIKLPGSLYVPNSPSRLLSPQHWAQTTSGDQPWCETYHDKVRILWNSGQRKKTAKLSKQKGNVASIYTAPGFQAYHAFMEEAGLKESEDLMVFNQNVISDDEGSNGEEVTRQPSREESMKLELVELASKQDGQTGQQCEFELDGPKGTATVQTPTIIEDKEDSPKLENIAAEFLKKHHCLNHLSMAKMQVMAKQGILPKKWAKCDIPICTSCLYGKATRRPWRRTEPKEDSQESKLRTATEPGQCISVDQLESRTPGLIAQVKGWLTKKRHQAATIFADHYSSLSYVFLQKSTNAEETLAAKISFERYAERHGVKVQAYQADNGRFAETTFMQAIRDAGQTINFCGVNAHFQNGVAERRIRSLQNQARTMLIHAQHRWPTAIDAHLWPYALRTANEVSNNAPTTTRPDMKSPIELFSKSPIRPNLDHFQPFGCPIFVLGANMQSGKKIPKWQLRSRMGINLVISNQHARSIVLVLNLTTGHASPQFHVKFDPKFQTVREALGNLSPHSEWQVECGFKPRRRNEKKKLTLRVEEAKKDHQQVQREEVEDQGQAHEDQGIDLAQGRRSTARLKDKPRVNFNEVELARPREEDNVAFVTIADESEEPKEVFALAASKDYTMYYHEAIRGPDREQFKGAMKQEVDAHTRNKVWELIKKSAVPKDHKIMPSVWSMKRKRKIATREIYKWKTRLNIDGSKQEEGVNFWETFAPVASWSTIRMVLILALIHGWDTRQIDFVLAYTQAAVECKLYMSIPKGFEVESDEEYVLKLKKNLFGQRQAGQVWNKHLIEKLKQVGFVASQIDECLSTKGKVSLCSTQMILFWQDRIPRSWTASLRR